MENRQFLLDAFYEDFAGTIWLLNKDAVYANKYFSLLSELEQASTLSNYDMELFIERFHTLKSIFYERAKNKIDWVAPKKRAINELTHNEAGKLTRESFELLKAAIANKTGEKVLISDTGKNISFDEKWYQMINSCSFKAPRC